MKIERGEIWLANLDPTQGSEQAGTRPIIIFQDSTLSKFTTTIITIPFTTNLRRATLPTCLIILKGQGGLNQDSVALCHQIRVLDKTRHWFSLIEGRKLYWVGVREKRSQYKLRRK